MKSISKQNKIAIAELLSYLPDEWLRSIEEALAVAWGKKTHHEYKIREELFNETKETTKQT